jgi:hypothetical protein
LSLSLGEEEELGVLEKKMLKRKYIGTAMEDTRGNR